MPTVDDAATETLVLLYMLIKVHSCRVLIESSCHHMLGFFDCHAVDVIDSFADPVVFPQMQAACKGRVITLHVQIVRHYKLAHADCNRQLWYNSLGCGRVQVVLTHHHPADVIDNHLAPLISAYRAHVDDARLAVLVLPEAYHGRSC